MMLMFILKSSSSKWPCVKVDPIESTYASTASIREKFAEKMNDYHDDSDKDEDEKYAHQIL